MNEEQLKTQEPSEQEKAEMVQALERGEKKFFQIVDLEKLEKNSILVFKLVPESIDILISLPFLVEKMKDILTEKNIAVMIMNPEDDMSVLSEKEMNRLGWEKKDKPRLITLDQI